jgi:hypothetical protein
LHLLGRYRGESQAGDCGKDRGRDEPGNDEP